MNTNILQHLKGDRVIWGIFFFLILASLLAVYSSSGIISLKKYSSTEYYFIKHFFIILVGMVLCYFAYLTPYKRYYRLANWMLLVSVVLLVLTMFFGIEVNNAKRWLNMPIVNIAFQPSDLAKISLIIYLAKAIAQSQESIKDAKSLLKPIVYPIVLTCAIIAPFDLSTSLMLFLTCFIMLYIGRVPVKYLFAVLVAGIVLLTFLIAVGQFFPQFVRVETWVSRVNEFVSGDGGYQIEQAKIAIANGEFFGLGAGKSIQKNYLPTPYADFIYSIICEEYGLIGAGFVIFLFVWLFIRACRILNRSTKLFGGMMAIGLSLLLVMQALANMAVSVNLVPVTGLTIPIISMGGTSLVFSCLAFGAILSMSRIVEIQKNSRRKSGNNIETI